MYRRHLKPPLQYILFLSQSQLVISMNSQTKPKIKPYFKLGSNYTLDINLKSSLLNIQLQVSQENPKLKKRYTKVYSEENIPSDLKFLQMGVDQLFQLCKNKAEVDTERGILTVAVSFLVNSKPNTKKINLSLDGNPCSPQKETQKVEECQLQICDQKIPQLRHPQESYKGLRNTIQQQCNKNIQDQQRNTQKQVQLDSTKLKQTQEEKNKPKQVWDLEEQDENIINCQKEIEALEEVEQSKEKVENEKIQQEIIQYDENFIQVNYIDVDEINLLLFEGDKRAKKSGKFSRKRKVKIYEKEGSSNFSADRNKITYSKDFDKKYKQVILDYKLSLSQQGNKYFIIKVISYQKGLSIGITDQFNIKAPMTQAAMLYHGRSSRVTEYKQSINQGNGFKPGDTVRVHISKGKVRWFVNQKLQATLDQVKLQKQMMEFYPIIEMNCKGDEVLWIS